MENFNGFVHTTPLLDDAGRIVSALSTSSNYQLSTFNYYSTSSSSMTRLLIIKFCRSAVFLPI